MGHAEIIPMIVSAILGIGLSLLSLLFVAKVLLGVGIKKYFKTISYDEVTMVFVLSMLFILFLVYFVVCGAIYNTFIR